VFRLERGAIPLVPGSWRLALNALSRPRRHTPTQMVAGWLPRGLFSAEPLKDQIRRVVPSGWGPHPGLRVIACDYQTGRRVHFGREDAPPAHLADAVAASCSIPGVYRPVEIGSRLYVDGGIYSTSNLDSLRAGGLDLVICLNPTSSLHPPRAWNPFALGSSLWRRASGNRLGSEAKKLRAAGTEVILIQPTGEDMSVMGQNLMSADNERRNRVIETAQRTVARQLAGHSRRSLLDDLPPGSPEKIERPSGPPADWPTLIGVAPGTGNGTAGTPGA
jgi:NTE family protein